MSVLTIGTHMSIAKGIANTAKNTVWMEANTMQIFSRNPRGSNFKVYTPKETEQFQTIRKEHRFGPLLAHAPYTMNLASDQERVYEFACTVIREDVARMDELDIEYLVFHPGSHTGIGVERGIQNIIRGLDQAVTGNEKITVLLETMSGKGTEIGARFEHLKAIRDGLAHPERIGICLDTCHVFAAGYDIVNELDKVLDEFDHVLGLGLLKAIHLNDSMMPFDSHKDRHAAFGEGLIGMEALLRVMRHPMLSGLPFYLETPLDDQGHKEEIRRIKEIISKNGQRDD
jgi:deoxyribonuclease-4